jgi:hypothetical protein
MRGRLSDNLPVYVGITYWVKWWATQIGWQGSSSRNRQDSSLQQYHLQPSGMVHPIYRSPATAHTSRGQRFHLKSLAFLVLTSLGAGNALRCTRVCTSNIRSKNAYITRGSYQNVWISIDFRGKCDEIRAGNFAARDTFPKVKAAGEKIRPLVLLPCPPCTAIQ